MAEPPSILMVSWNRREYYERTLAHVLADPSDFRLYLWDNGSQDGVADLVRDTKDDRIALRHTHPENVRQFEPWHWFLANAKGTVGGKLDDDILGPQGWMTRFADMLEREPKLGGLAGWIFTPEDWDEAAARHKIIQVGSVRLFENAWVPGCMFLARFDVLRRFTSHDYMPGLPLRWAKARRAGFHNGFPMPLEQGENLDDPRHPDCRMNRPGGWDQFAAFTARRQGFKSPAEYGEWIARDARAILDRPVMEQLRTGAPTIMQDLQERARRGLRKVGRLIGG